MKRNNPIRRLLYILAVTLFLFFIRFNNVIIFKSPAINDIIFILVWVGTLFLFVQSLALKNLFARISLSILFGLLALIDVIFVFFTLFNLAFSKTTNGEDLSFKTIDQLNYKNKQIKVYRTDGGATTAWGIVVRSEIKIFPGLLLANEFLRAYPIDTVTLELKSNSTLRILDTRENNRLLKEINLEECQYNFFPAWKDFFTGKTE